MTTDILNCIAIDDEPLALEITAAFAQRMGGLRLQTFSDPIAGLAAIERERPDVVFLDIEMGNISGIDIARRLPEGTCLIFTTAYLDYAPAGFELDAVDYLHKPFSYDRFRTAVGKAVRRRREVESRPQTARTLVVKQEYSNVAIPLSGIKYIEAMEGYVKIFRLDGVCTITRMLLKNIGAQLPAEAFLRVHRSFIVARSCVESYTRREVVLAGGVVIPVGRQYAAEVADVLSR